LCSVPHLQNGLNYATLKIKTFSQQPSTMNTQQLLDVIEKLSPELQQQLYDLAISLDQQSPIKQRTVGEYVDKIRLHPDFNNPLPDEFWLGTE